MTLRELIALRSDVGERAPTLRERVAGGGFLIQFYNGVENVLKRITKYHCVPMPSGEKWHAELFERFTEPPAPGLPALFDADLAEEMTAFRGFRHIVRTSYGVELDWTRMKKGIDRLEPVFARFRRAALRHLESLDA